MKRKWQFRFFLLLLSLLLTLVLGCAQLVQNPRYIYENGAVIVGGDGKPIELINNPNSTNPTYAELIAFIEKDTTDSQLYLEGFESGGTKIIGHVCTDFAEDLHNNAEVNGIRAAWVGIDLKGSATGHALNAFETTDKGLVYVDCTGRHLGELLRQYLEKEPFSKNTSRDGIAYVEMGKEYGVIDIAKAKSPSYSFYEEYKNKWQEYEKLLAEYNVEVMQYNQEIAGKIYYEGSPEVARIEAWEARLEEKGQLINELAEELGDIRFEPMGIVQDIHIYWGNS